MLDQVFCAIGWAILVVVAAPWILYTVLVQFTWAVSHLRTDGDELSYDWLQKEAMLGVPWMDDYAMGKKAWFWIEELRVDQKRAATDHEPGNALRLALRIRPLSRACLRGLPIPCLFLLACEAIEQSWFR